MDGVLFDYEGQLRKDLDRITSDIEWEQYDYEKYSVWDLEKMHPWIRERMDLIKNQVNWWRSLPKFTPGWEVYDMAIAAGFQTQILTKGPQKRPIAWGEKRQCIIDHLGEDVAVNVVSENKSYYYGRILVDDYPEFIEGWLEHRPRGLAIMPLHSYNENFSHPNVIHYDGRNGEEIQRAIQAAHDRESQQHWKDLL